MSAIKLSLRNAAIRRLYQAMEHGECALSIFHLAVDARRQSENYFWDVQKETEGKLNTEQKL